jgi:DHA2 family multidrug resistance protein
MMVAPIAGRVVRRYDPRISMVLGLLIAAIGVWPGHAITKDWGFWNFAWLQALRSFGVMLAMIGSQMLAMSTLAPQLIKSASGILNLARNTGGAVGLAVLSSALSSQTAEHMNDLTSRVSIASTQAQGMLAGLSQRMAGLGVPDPQGAARKAFDFMIAQDATVLAFGDGFAMLAVGCVAAACVSLLAKPGAIAMMPPPMKDAH